MPEPNSTSAVLDRLASGGTESPTSPSTPSNAEGTNPTEEPNGSQPSGTSTETTPESTPEESGTQSQTQPEGEEVPEATQGESQSETEIEETPEGANFSKFKPLFKDHPGLREVIARHDAYSELFPKFSELRELRERFPDQAAVEDTVNLAEEHRRMGETFRSDPQTYLESLRESDQGAYQNLIRNIPDVLAATDVDQFAHFAQRFSSQVIENLWGIAQDSRDQTLLDAVNKVASALGIRPGMPTTQRTDPRDSELARYRQREREREQQAKESQFDQFQSAVDRDYAEQTLAAIEEMLPPRFKEDDDIKLRLVPEIYQAVRKAMASQPQTVARVQRELDNIKKSGKAGASEQRALVAFMVSKAKATLPLVGKDVISKWTRMVTSKSKQSLDQKKDIAQKTREAASQTQTQSQTNGNPATSSQQQRQANPNGVSGSNGNGKGKTKESLLDSLSNGTYQERARNIINA